MTDKLLKRLSSEVLLGDGAMGTQLQAAGLEPGGCGEAWNVDHPEKILEIQRRYVSAGSDCLITNTFGGSRVMLERHGEGERVVAINEAAVRIARQAFDDAPGFVIGDIGPFGGLLEPIGDVPVATVEQAFLEQARALAGTDAIIIETQTSLEELGIGITAAREAGAPVVIGSIAFDLTHDGEDFRTMMGTSPEQAAEFMEERNVDILAFNCGTGIDMESGVEIARRYRRVSQRPIMAQPNAGQPELEDFQAVYHETPEHMAAGIPALLEAGVRIIGGCCGSTPAHIAEFRNCVSK